MAPPIDIHGRRQIGTHARGPVGAGRGGRRTSTGAFSAAEATAAARSARVAAPRRPATARTWVACDRPPRRREGLGIGRRFSSVSITTTSGLRATMAAMSGFLVPPTVRRPGASQKRVTATGPTPQASRVSVTDGTRLTTRTTPVTGHSQPVEQICFLGLELGVGDDALLPQGVELLDLGGDRPRRARTGGPGRRGAGPDLVEWVAMTRCWIRAGWGKSGNTSALSRPADSSVTLPAPMMRSKKPWW